MKRILCYGDSNTFGFTSIFSPTGPGRLADECRWTNLLRKELGTEYRIIDEGLNGRTTAYDDPETIGRNGALFLPICLEMHMPLDLVVLMLGTNDAKRTLGLETEDIVQGMRKLVEIVRTYPRISIYNTPDILIVAPVPMAEPALADSVRTDENSLRKTRELATGYETLAKELGCEFMDLNTISCTKLSDGIHLSEKAHAAAAQAFAAKIRSME